MAKLIHQKFQSTLFNYEERNNIYYIIELLSTSFNPLSSITKREILRQFTSCLSKQNVSIHSLQLRREKWLSDDPSSITNNSFNPLSSITKREILGNWESSLFYICFNPLSSITKREITNQLESIKTRYVSIHSLQLRREKSSLNSGENICQSVSIHSLQLRREK